MEVTYGPQNVFLSRSRLDPKALPGAEISCMNGLSYRAKLVAVGPKQWFGKIFQSEQQVGDSQEFSLNGKKISDRLEKNQSKSSKQEKLARGGGIRTHPHLVVNEPTRLIPKLLTIFATILYLRYGITYILFHICWYHVIHVYHTFRAARARDNVAVETPPLLRKWFLHSFVAEVSHLCWPRRSSSEKALRACAYVYTIPEVRKQ